MSDAAAELGYTKGRWARYVNYTCSRCPFATLILLEIEEHVEAHAFRDLTELAPPANEVPQLAEPIEPVEATAATTADIQADAAGEAASAQLSNEEVK